MKTCRTNCRKDKKIPANAQPALFSRHFLFVNALINVESQGNTIKRTARGSEHVVRVGCVDKKIGATKKFSALCRVMIFVLVCPADRRIPELIICIRATLFETVFVMPDHAFDGTVYHTRE